MDILRAAAALGVLVGHAYALGGRAIPVRAERWYDVPLLQTVTGVWLFFAISGYVISKPFVDRLLTGRPLPELVPYALRRALRIFPLYWIALLAVIALAGAGPMAGGITRSTSRSCTISYPARRRPSSRWPGP